MPEFEVRFKTVNAIRPKGFTGQIGTICFHGEEKQSLEEIGANFIIRLLYEAGCQIAKLKYARFLS